MRDHQPDESVSFAIHCERIGVHTLSVSAMGSVVLSHHANPAVEYTLRRLGREGTMPMCLRWWRALEEHPALRERLYTLARQGINPLAQIRVTEQTDGTVTVEERPMGQGTHVSLESIMWDLQHARERMDQDG